MPPRRHDGLDVTVPAGTGRTLPRREFLRLLAGTVGGAVVLQAVGRPRAYAAPVGTVFPDGVKCGDPHHSRGTLWTRVAAPANGEPATVLWSVAEDAAMQQVVHGGVVTTDAAQGYG